MKIVNRSISVGTACLCIEIRPRNPKLRMRPDFSKFVNARVIKQ